MSQPNMRSEGNARSSARGNVAAKSREAAERIESSVADGVERVRSQADDAREQAAERIRRLANQLRSVGENLRTDDAVAASLADRASRGIESVAEYVSSTDARRIIRDTERLARREPAWFYGGAFLAGLAAGRFLRSSRPEGYGSEPRRFEREFDQRRIQQGPFDDDERAGPVQGSGQRESTPRGWTSPSEEAMRRNQTSQERFRENYDAAFGRDVGAGRDVTAERGVGVGAERGTRPSNASSTPGASSGSSFARSDAPSNNPSAERPRNAAFDPQKGSGT